MVKLHYPITSPSDQSDNYHGTRVADPYRWLEDVDSPDTLRWIRAQNEITFSFLEKIPARQSIHKRMTALWNYARAQAPYKRGAKYFQLRNSGLQNQDVLVVLEHLEAEPRLILDPNTLSKDGTVALTSWSVSPDGRWLAYAVSSSGSDWLTWRIRDIESGLDLPDQLFWSKFSEAEWLPDSTGFYYGRYAEPVVGQEYHEANYFQKLVLHKLGDSQAADRMIYERPDQKEWGFSPTVTDDGQYLILSVWQGTEIRNRLFYLDFNQPDRVVELIADLEASYTFIGNDGPIFYLRSDFGAPRGCLIAIDIRKPEHSNWVTLIPEAADVFEGAVMGNDLFVCLFLHHAHHQIILFGRNGFRIGEILLPTLGALWRYSDLGIHCKRQDRELFFTFQSFTYPATVYRYDFESGLCQAIFTPAVDFDPQLYDIRQVFVTSKDGVEVPMFLIGRTGWEMTGQKPTLLYGYGGFNIPVLPAFTIPNLVWLEMGGILAVANLRGGGEYGEDWHRAGMLDQKQNVFDDFIACSEYLIKNQVTNPKRLAIHGRSNGGLLVGACLAQRPELFGAALPAVGVMDMLRFQKFTIGWAWVSDYGSADDPEQFKTLLAYSPLHNLHPGSIYPATLVTTGDHDDRVVPGHSFKFAATLQTAQAGDAPILIRIQTKAGHGFGKPTTILIEEFSDQWAFLAETLNMNIVFREAVFD